MLESLFDYFGIMLGWFWNNFWQFGNQFGIIIFEFCHWGNQVLIIGGTRPGGLGEPPPRWYTIRFSIRIVRTPKASLVGEKCACHEQTTAILFHFWFSGRLNVDEGVLDARRPIRDTCHNTRCTRIDLRRVHLESRLWMVRCITETCTRAEPGDNRFDLGRGPSDKDHRTESYDAVPHNIA